MVTLEQAGRLICYALGLDWSIQHILHRLTYVPGAHFLWLIQLLRAVFHLPILEISLMTTVFRWRLILEGIKQVKRTYIKQSWPFNPNPPISCL